MAATPTAFELWAASKIIGRECATENKLFFICKKEKGLNPLDCEAESSNVTNCVSKILGELNTSFPKEFSAFQKCLDFNDYRFGDCRTAERELLDCWNKKMQS
eukprot:gene852-1658_t